MVSREELKEARKTRSVLEAAKLLGISHRQAERWSARYQLTDYECKHGYPLDLLYKLTEEQIDILDGSMLGDGFLFKPRSEK